ncbi:MAG: sigma 54-interacting transcriptional regulator [Acidobacteriota bacterium]|nr:sigma 54-interacting transcriptional regulator [Acidobacteriota bacterium]
MQSSSEERLRFQLEASTRVERHDQRSREVARGPGLTIVWHPDPRRIGERALLPDLAAGRPVRLSRTEPVFAASSGSLRSSPRPLADPFLSRRPLILEPREGGGLRLHGALHRLPLEVVPPPAESPGESPTGDSAEAEVLLPPEALEEGRLLLLAGRVLLLLHRLEALPPQPAPPLGLVGRSDAMERLRRQILEVAPSSYPVLLRGETGSGKELVARALHDKGSRPSGPFVAVNLAALPPSLAPAELFGARKGAFTGAGEARAGRFAAAHGGTLFLDEIGEASPEVQVLLLRALESGEVQAVGSDRPRKLDARVVAATDADLEQRIGEDRFKAPLLHRLNACTLRLPPLRRRREDVGLLLLHFLRQELAAWQLGAILEPAREPHQEPHREPDGGTSDPWLPASLVARLAAYSWPGNVRELRNVARHLVLRYRQEASIPLAAWQELQRDLLTGDPAAGKDGDGPAAAPSRPSSPPSSFSEPQAGEPEYRSSSAVSDEELLHALDAHGWKVASTAAALGLSRTSLYRRMDSCPEIRRASQIPAEEVQAALAAHDGEVSSAARQLRVSPHGLKLRVADLASSESA